MAELHNLRIVEDGRLVLNWLRSVDQQELVDAVSELDDSASICPTTPPRRGHMVYSYDEISPTNTSFSDNTIFDLPDLPDGTPIEDPFCDDIPNVAPTDDSYRGLRGKIERRGINATQTTQIQLDASPSDTYSLTSHDPPSEAVTELETRHESSKEIPRPAAASLVDPNKPRFTRITSCIQCILADLPCSRTTPCCSRCKRNGNGNVCLLHRQKYADEIDRSDATTCTTPVLLKLRSEDEELWTKKRQLAEKVCP